MDRNTRRGDFVMRQEDGAMGVVENVSGCRDAVDVRMNGTEELVTVTEEEFEDWS